MPAEQSPASVVRTCLDPVLKVLDDAFDGEYRPRDRTHHTEEEDGHTLHDGGQPGEGERSLAEV